MSLLTSPASPIFQNLYLIKELIRRDVSGRYRGSTMGLLWSFFNPILMLIVYTFFFSSIFKARWTAGDESKGEFALILFAGLIAFNFFAECVTRSPGLMVANTNYVKKIVFPVEILVLVTAGSALFHACVSLIAWLIFSILFLHKIQLTTLLIPLAILPLLLLTTGISWIFSALGAYVRDTGQFVNVLVSVMPFTTPLFFPLTALPESFQAFVYLNPLTLTIEILRDILIWGKIPDIKIYLIYLTATGILAILGLAFFNRCKRGFSDVL